MNMTFKGGENATPVFDEDDPARRQYLEQILQIHRGTLGVACTLGRSDIIGPYTYTLQRVRFLTYCALIYKAGRITKERYKEFAQMQNGDILYSNDFQDNFDVRNEVGKSISDLLAENSTW